MKYSSGLIIILIILEIFMASFIIYTETTATYSCVSGFHCETVLTSPYSHVGPIKVSYIGLVAFLVLLIVYLLVYNKKLPYKIFFGLVILGCLGSLTLLSIQNFAIGGFCSNCLITDIIMLIITGLGIYEFVKERR